MNRFQNIIQKIIYRRVDPSTLEPNHAQKIKYIYTILLLMLVLGAPFLFRAIQWNIPIRIFGVGSALALSIALIVVNPYRRYTSLNGNITIIALLVAVIPAILSNGGFSGAAIGWLTIMPLLGGFVSGQKSAIAWAIISISLLVFFYILEQKGVYLPNLTPEQHSASQKLLQYLGIITALFFIVSKFLSSIKASEDQYKQLISEREIEIKSRKQAELVAQKASEAKSQFIANISHELRTPMNAIIGMSQLTLDSHLNKEQQHLVEVIDNSGQLLLRLINDILDFSKIEANKLQINNEPFLFDEMIFNLATMFNVVVQEKNLTLYLDIDPNIPPTLIADELRVSQVLSNLISNAIKFTDTGTVTVSATAEHKTDKELALSLTISDTGVGIPPEKIESLFAPFTQADASTTRQYGGTGLGLSISKRLIELMGGTIRVLSTENQGSHFGIQLPVHYNKQTPENSSYNELYQKVSKTGTLKTVLIAVDDSHNRTTLFTLLNSFSFCCIEHSSPAEQVDQHIDWLITDWARDDYMPLMKTSKSDTCIILRNASNIVGSHNDTNDQQLHGSYNFGFIATPLCRSTLLTALGHLIDIKEQPKVDPVKTACAVLPLSGLMLLIVEDNIVN